LTVKASMLAIIKNAPRVLSVTSTLLEVHRLSQNKAGLWRPVISPVANICTIRFWSTKKAPAATGAFSISIRPP